MGKTFIIHEHVVIAKGLLISEIGRPNRKSKLQLNEGVERTNFIKFQNYFYNFTKHIVVKFDVNVHS